MGFFDVVKRLFASGRKGSVIGIDVGSSAVKIVELEKRHGKATLVKYGTLALGPYAGKDTGAPVRLPLGKTVEAVKAALSAIGVKGKEGALAIPLKLSLIVTFELPEAARKNLDQAVPVEARRFIPGTPSEINIAWSVLSEAKEKSMTRIEGGEIPKIKILVAAIHNTTIETYRDLSTKIGISPALLEIETFSAMRATTRGEPGLLALLDIGSEDSKVVMSEGVSVVGSHTISRGSNAFTEAISYGSSGISYADAEKMKRRDGLGEKNAPSQIRELMRPDIEHIFTEAKKTIDDFEKRHKAVVSKVVLLGGGSMLFGLVSYAEAFLGKRVEKGDAFRNIALPVPQLAALLRESGPEYAVSSGLALRALEE